jgi:hypothetical protein
MIRPLGGLPPAGPPAARDLAALWAYFVCFSYYQLLMLSIIMVCLTVGLAYPTRQWTCNHGRMAWDVRGVERWRSQDQMTMQLVRG